MSRKTNNSKQEQEAVVAGGHAAVADDESPVAPPSRQQARAAARRAKKRESAAERRAAELEVLKKRVSHAKALGRSQRRPRVDRLQWLLEEEWLAEHPDASRATAAEEAARQVAQLRGAYDLLEPTAERLAPYFEGVPTDINDAVVVNAILRLPAVRYLKLALERPGAAGPNHTTKLPAAGFLWMTLASGGASASRAFEEFGGGLRAAWATHRPGVGKTTRNLTNRMRDAIDRAPLELPRHVLVELVREQAEAVDPETGALRYPGAMDLIAADGCLIQADVPQRKPLPDERARLDEAGMRNVDFVWRGDKDSWRQGVAAAEVDPGTWLEPQLPKEPTPHCGWKLVVLHSLRLNMPVIAGLFSPKVDERHAVLRLLGQLHDLWPGLKIRTFVGDGLYDTHDFNDQLSRRFGIRVCASRGLKPGAKWGTYESVDTQRKTRRTVKLDWGVPVCEHGPMELFSVESDNCNPEWRAEQGLEPRQAVERDTVALKFRCRGGMKDGDCRPVRIRPHKWNARLASPYPRIKVTGLKLGELIEKGKPKIILDQRGAERAVLTSMRNQVESLFAALQQDKLAGKATQRARWAQTDHRMEFMLQTALVGRAARVIAWREGLIDEAQAEADALGVLQYPDHNLQMPTTLELVEAVLGDEPEILPRAPRTWDDHGFTYRKRLSRHEEQLRRLMAQGQGSQDQVAA